MINLFIDDTIAAIATAPGEGGIGIIRISGSNSLKVAEEIFKAVSGKKISEYNLRTLIYGNIFDGEKREQSLIRYANKVAREVAKTKKTKKLDYMNPYERRIIHSALQNDKYVITYSEGEEPHRRLVIEYKR